MRHPVQGAMLRATQRLGLAAVAVIPVLLSSSVPAAAYINGGCTATATDSSGRAQPATIEVQSTDTWNVSKDSQLSGTGHAPTPQNKGFAYAEAFGLSLTLIPIAGGEGTPNQGGTRVTQRQGLRRQVQGLRGVGRL